MARMVRPGAEKDKRCLLRLKSPLPDIVAAQNFPTLPAGPLSSLFNLLFLPPSSDEMIY